MLTELPFSPVSLPSLSHPDAERIETQSRTRGHAAGYAAGIRAAQKEQAEQQAVRDAEYGEAMNAGLAEIERAVATLAAAARAADARTALVVQESQDALAAATIELAEAVLGHELSDGDRSARSALARALGTVPRAEVTGVRLNPQDLERLDPDVVAQAGVDLIADPSLLPGDALALLPDGYLDARIGAALGRAKAALAGDLA